jgi:hypothetical protein
MGPDGFYQQRSPTVSAGHPLGLCSTRADDARERGIGLAQRAHHAIGVVRLPLAVPDQRRHSASEHARERAYGSTSLRAAPRPGHVRSSSRLCHRRGELDEEVVGGFLRRAVDETLAELG